MRIAIPLIVCLLAGCSPARVPDRNATESSMLRDIQSVIAGQLGRTVADVKPNLTFAAIGADDLDLVEITMEVEDRFGIAIRDDALVTAANTNDSNSLCDHLTVAAFASVAEVSPKQSPLERLPNVADEGVLRESQVGGFGDLSQLPNPNGLVLVFIPSLEELTQIQEQRLGRKMDDTETNALRQKAAVIAMPPQMAEQLKKQKSERGNPSGAK